MEADSVGIHPKELIAKPTAGLCSPAPAGSVVPSIDEMASALSKAGWTGKGTIWTAPDGRIYRGPALAYHMMMGLQWPPPNMTGEPRGASPRNAPPACSALHSPSENS